MDCLVNKDDCCARLGGRSLHERLRIQRMALEVRDTAELPHELEELMGPYRAFAQNLDEIGVGSEDRTVVTPWCTKVRAAIAQFRAAAPAAWKAATHAADHRAAEAKAAVEAHTALVNTLVGWSKALEGSRPVMIPTDIPDSKQFVAGRKAIERYQEACH